MTDAEVATATRRRATPWALIFAVIFLALLGLVFVGVCVHGFTTGWLTPAWQRLTDTQVSLISNVATLYAAAFAATVAPLIFRGQMHNLERASEEAIGELRQQFTQLAAEHRATNEQILALAEQSRASFSVLQNYALQTMGFVEVFTADQLPDAPSIVGGFQNMASLLCEKALRDSNKWQSTKAQFQGMWPGFRPYIQKLHDCGIIDIADRDKFFLIADSRRYNRAANPDQIDLATLNVLNKTSKELQEKFGEK